ncbi:MAG TPA: hypothetical protein VFX98_18770 [Longimicrobiaceae bacterium]|nr:hypothetical protein [Longimicrobiaceae bacterium]
MTRGAATLAVLVLGAAQAAIWQGSSGGFAVRWTERDLTAARAAGGAPVLSLRTVENEAWAEMSSDSVQPALHYAAEYRVLSLVGRVLSVSSRHDCNCGGAHPISWSGFHAYDLARGTREKPHPIEITELFPAADVRAALVVDPVVRRMLAASGAGTPRTLEHLVTTLQESTVEVAGCTYTAGPDFLASFALHHLEGGRAAVRFSLPYRHEVCRGRMIQLGVLIPVPPRLRAELEAAGARRAGFLMQDAQRISGGRATTLEYGPPALR